MYTVSSPPQQMYITLCPLIYLLYFFEFALVTDKQFFIVNVEYIYTALGCHVMFCVCVFGCGCAFTSASLYYM